MMTEKRSYKRTRYIVEKNIQFRFVSLLVLNLVIFFFIAVLIIYFSGWRQLIEKMANVYPQGRLTDILNAIYLRFCVGFLFLLPVAAISAILVSHKIAGPLVRIKWALRQLIDGNYDIFIKLRKGDRLKDVADDINKLAGSLKRRNVR